MSHRPEVQIEIGETDFLLFCNMYSERVLFTIPQPRVGGRWVHLIDTATWAEPVFNCWSEDAAAVVSGRYEVEAFSVVVLREMG